MSEKSESKGHHRKASSHDLDKERSLTIDHLGSLFRNEYDKDGRKIFRKRESYLTIMFRQRHFMALYNLALALWIATILNFTFKYFVYYENIQILTNSLWKILTNFHTLLIVVAIYNMLAISLYFLLKLFAISKPFKPSVIFYSLWFIMLLSYMVLFFYISILFMNETNGFPFGRLVAVLEQVRLLMKMYAFMHDTVPGIIRRQLNVKDSQDSTFPKISSYIYYIFCPTLVYRDEYPRTEKINWEFFILNMSGCVCSGMAMMYLVHFYFIVKFSDVGKTPMTLTKIITLTLESVLPSTMFSFFVFFGFLHTFLNAASEISMFGDRMFYTDWWNSTNFSEYYKKWNILVHDWIKSYMFEDIRRSFKGSKGVVIGSIVVITISSLIHEYITYMIIQSLVPGFMVMFGFFGIIVKFINPKLKGNRTERYVNISLLWSLVFGLSVLLTVYFGEYFSAVNCPLPMDSPFYLYLIPRLITADCVIET